MGGKPETMVQLQHELHGDKQNGHSAQQPGQLPHTYNLEEVHANAMWSKTRNATLKPNVDLTGGRQPT